MDGTPWPRSNAPQVGWETGSSNLLASLLALSPVTLPLGLYGAARLIRHGLAGGTEDREAIGGWLWAAWLAVACVALAFWRTGPRQSLELFLLVPLNLLAASTVGDLVNRRISLRAVMVLAPATGLAIAWWTGEELRGAVDDLFNGRATGATILRLSVASAVFAASVLLVRRPGPLGATTTTANGGSWPRSCSPPWPWPSAGCAKWSSGTARPTTC